MFKLKPKLSNPDQRRPLRDDFPPVVNLALWCESSRWKLGAGLNERIGQEIEKSLGSVSAATRITVAYPHKAPGWIFAHDNGLRPHVAGITNKLEQAFPEISFEIADGLCEKHQLNRSAARNQNVIKTAMKQQPFYYVPKLQGSPISLLAEDRQEKELFILVDDVFCQGTTAANMISFIEHNGGHVLTAAAVEGVMGHTYHAVNPCSYLPQQEIKMRGSMDNSRYDRDFKNGQALRGTFKNAAYNKGCLPVLAEAFYQAAQKEGVYADMSHEQHLEVIDQSLRAHGRSLSTMTNGECYHMANFFGGSRSMEPVYVSYKSLVRAMKPAFLSYGLN